MKQYFKRFFQFIFVFTIIISGFVAGNIKVNASSTTYYIDTSSKLSSLKSIKKIFDTWKGRGMENIDVYEQADALRFYRYYESVATSLNPSQATIQNSLAAVGITYAYQSVSSKYTAIRMEKYYDYSEPINYMGIDYSYMGESAFNNDYEAFYILIYATYIQDPNGPILDASIINPNSLNTNEEIYIAMDDNNISQEVIGGKLIEESTTQAVVLPGKIVTEVHSYAPIKRFWILDQSIYGYPSGYIPFAASITYTSYSPLITAEATITLIDTDKLIIIYYGNQEGVYMTLEQHYERNVYQPTFPDTLGEAKTAYNDLEKQSSTATYFHRLATYDGDTSNYSNVKYTMDSSMGTYARNMWPNSSYEVIYNGNTDTNRIKNDSLIMGTFNYSDAAIIGGRPHYMYDVYPYLIWGNTSNDPSTIKERFIWEKGSADILFNTWYQLRGESLHAKFSFTVSTQLTTSEYNILAARLGN